MGWIQVDRIMVSSVPSRCSKALAWRRFYRFIKPKDFSEEREREPAHSGKKRARTHFPVVLCFAPRAAGLVRMGNRLWGGGENE